MKINLQVNRRDILLYIESAHYHTCIFIKYYVLIFAYKFILVQLQLCHNHDGNFSETCLIIKRIHVKKFLLVVFIFNNYSITQQTTKTI